MERETVAAEILVCSRWIDRYLIHLKEKIRAAL